MSAQVNRCARPRRLSFVLAGLLLGTGSVVRAALPPELILFHGRALAMDPHDSIADALAIRDGKIVAIGTDRDILRLAAAATRDIDLHGQTPTPGLIDSHSHIADAGVIELYHVDLSDASSVAEVVRRVKAGI